MMVQQTTSRKSGNGLKILEGLVGDRGVKADLKRDVQLLANDYTEFASLAANLSSHSKWIPYPFLAERLKTIADEIRGFEDILRAKIVELGGQIHSEGVRSTTGHDDPAHVASEGLHDDGTRPSTGWDLSRQNVKRLVKDMEDHSSCCERLQHQKYRIADPGIAKLINLMIVDMQRQRDDLIDIVMRLS